ncbi:MAG: cache domain-containing sensor histidine kinase [Bacillota bacterium]
MRLSLRGLLYGERIQGRLFRSFALLTLVPVLLLGFTSYFIASALIQARAGMDAVRLLKQVGRNLDREIDGITQFANLIFSSDSVSAALATKAATQAELFHRGMNVLRFVEDYVQAGYGVELSSVVIAGFNGEKFIYGDRIEVDLGAWSRELWYQRALAADGGIVWLGTHPNLARRPFATEDRVFSLVRVLKDLHAFRAHGILIVSVKLSEFERIFRDADVTGQGRLVVLDGEGRPLLFSEPAAAEFLAPLHLPAAGREGYRTVLVDGRRHLLAQVRSPNTGWVILQAMPVEVLTAESGLIRNITILTCLISLAILLVLSYRFADGLTRPLRDLAAAMRQVEQGDLQAGADCEGNDEIAWLAGRFNRMMAQIVRLFNQVEEEGRRKRQAELAALQAQINPHFLYNTLNGVRWLVLMGEEPARIGQVITSLVKLLQSTLGRDEEFHPLAEEIELVKSYLTIQEMRYRDKFKVEYALEAEVMKAPIPRLILQPLVENAIFHGIEPGKGPGTIRIAAGKDPGRLRIEVSDDGVGIPAEILSNLFVDHQKPRKSFSGIGLRNVHERIQLLYGNEYGLRVESERGHGTRIIMFLPEGGAEDVQALDRG